MPKIICAQCKAIEDVEEAPSSIEPVLCSECKVHARPTSKLEHASPSRRAKRKFKSVPRRKHGTRVMLPITCAECGASDTLDYVPKGADLDDVLCSDCAREQFGTDSDWARIERKKSQESDGGEWAFECDTCGETDYLPFEPKPEREYTCNLCRFDHDTPSRERLEGREKAAGGVFIRRNSSTDE